MVKHVDLVNRLELSVQQEIKNYKDSLSLIFLKFNKLKEEIDFLENLSRLENNNLISKLKDIEIQFSIQNTKHDENIAKTSRDVKSLENKFKNLEERFNLSLFHVLESKKNSIHNNNSIEFLKSRIAILEDEIKSYSKIIHHEMECTNRQIRKDVKNAIDEFCSRPSEAIEVKRQLEEKINSHVVDVGGLLKEIKITNKNMMILEKKIENIYTLIDRLQKSEEKP